MLYSIALLTVGRQWVVKRIGVGLFTVFATLIGIGGAVSGSKVFLFGGLPVAVIYLLLNSRALPVRRIAAGCGAATAAVLAAWYVLSTSNQLGLEKLQTTVRVWDLEEPRSVLFAGRLDPDGTALDILHVALTEAGPFGVGALGVRGPYDIGIIEFAAVAGWVGVVAMVLISIVLLVASASLRHDRYWLALSSLVVCANVGGPAFTANRNALSIWVLFGAMILGGHAARAARVNPPAESMRLTRHATIAAPVASASCDRISGMVSSKETTSGTSRRGAFADVYPPWWSRRRSPSSR
jgi:hypothetical protein